MAGPTYYGVSLLEGQEGKETRLIFETCAEALEICKKFKGARFKCFTDRQEAEQFTLHKQIVQETDTSVKDVPGEKLPYPTPSPQDMLLFRRSIETGNCDEFLKLIWRNPRFLISSGDTPTMVRERYRYHALLLATFKKEFAICKTILETITDPSFMALLYTNDTEEVRKKRMQYLLETYLNTPDKFLNETPLHFASKFGCAEIVELLISFTECDRERKNTRGETAADIIGDSSRTPSPETDSLIAAMLTDRYFIPILRPVDYSSPAQIGKPWSPDTYIKSPGSHVTSPLAAIQPKHPADSQMMLQAFAGPMSPTEADLFYLQLKSPPVPKHFSNNRLTPRKILDSRLSDIEKGLERVGRNVARDLNVPWCEYWAFLDEFCDLSSPEGLDLLENYLRQQRDSIDLQPPEPEISSKVTSPLSELCQQLNNLRLQSPGQLEKDDEEFYTPPSTPPLPFYEILSFYIMGPEPSKVDVDVLRVLETTEIDSAKFPNISMWKENMQIFNEDHLNRLKTPATVGRNSILKSPLVEHKPQKSPRVSSLKKRLNSPCKTRDSVPKVRLSERFENI